MTQFFFVFVFSPILSLPSNKRDLDARCRILLVQIKVQTHGDRQASANKGVGRSHTYEAVGIDPELRFELLVQNGETGGCAFGVEVVVQLEGGIVSSTREAQGIQETDGEVRWS